MKEFWKSGFDRATFEAYYRTAMLMALVVHIFYKDWGALGAFGILTMCMMWATFQGYMRFKDRTAV